MEEGGPAPLGFVHVERGSQVAYLLTPDEIEPDRRYPLVTVFHGAGRQDEMLVKASTSWSTPTTSSTAATRSTCSGRR